MGSTIADLAASLSKTRDYAVDARSWPEGAETIVAAAAEKIRAFGFCVVDYAVSADDALVGAVHDEVWAATQLIEAAGGGDRAQDQAGFGGGGDVGVETEVQLQPTCELVHLPQFSAAMASGPVSSIARAVLDDHVRLTRTHTRHVPPDFPEDGQPSNDRPMPSGRKKRGWHTDWPHDLAAHGVGAMNAGALRHPFPDVCMALSTVWYLNDTDASSGGTWIVPCSHVDPRSPRNPGSGINVMAPIAGEIQVECPAGSVLLQDTRTWHAQAQHNSSGRPRVAVVSRWCPWWLSVREFGVDAGLSLDEYTALPVALQPFVRHMCEEVQDVIQDEGQEAAVAAAVHMANGFVDEGGSSNAHVQVTPRVSRL